jgi:DNA-directed RNA polymerase alpha subunit
LVITGLVMVSLFTAAVTSMMMSGDSDMLKEVKDDMTKLSNELKDIKSKS